MCTIMVCVRNFPHLVVVVCVSWGRRFALWRRCRPGSHCKALYSYLGFFSFCWWMVGLYAAPVPVSSGGSNRWQSPLPCLKNRAVELLTHKAQTTTTNRPICFNYCPIFATVCVLCPLKRTDDDQRDPHITNGEIRHWISIMNTKVKCYSTVRISHVLQFSFRSHAGYFSFLTAQWFSKWLWHELPGSSKIWDKKIYSRHAWESLRSVTFPPLCMTRSWWNSAPWAATSTPGVWTNKAFFVLSCQAEKRDHLRLPGGALRLHIFMSHIFTKFSRYPRRFCSNVHSSSDGVTTVTWSCNGGVYCWFRRSLPIRSHVLGGVVIR